MICDYCFMERILVLKLPVTLMLDEEEAKPLYWGKNRYICTMCIESEAALFEQEQAEKKKQ